MLPAPFGQRRLDDDAVVGLLFFFPERVALGSKEHEGRCWLPSQAWSFDIKVQLDAAADLEKADEKRVHPGLELDRSKCGCRGMDAVVVDDRFAADEELAAVVAGENEAV